VKDIVEKDEDEGKGEAEDQGEMVADAIEQVLQADDNTVHEKVEAAPKEESVAEKK
jgi:hypothetical protein